MCIRDRFFTWGISGRYEYIPTAAVSLLGAELLHHWHTATPRWMPRFARTALIGTLALVLLVRSTHFAREGSEDQRALSEPFRVVAAAVLATPRDASGGVRVDAALLTAIPPNLVDAVVRVSLCRAYVHAVIDGVPVSAPQ